MSIFGDIFNFIKGLFTRDGLKDFLKKYQSLAIAELEDLVQVHSGQGLNEWWDEAFAKVKAEVQADAKNFHDTWVSIIIDLAYETIRAKQEKGEPEPTK